MRSRFLRASLSAVLFVVLAAVPAFAQQMSPAQRVALKAHIAATPDLNAIYETGDLQALADALNANAAPDYWIWRTAVSRAEVYNETSVTGSIWNWQIYKNQSVTEQNAWMQMFMGDVANFSKANLRAGVANIFSGSAGANDQRDHILAIARERCSRFERVFAVDTVGSGAQRGAAADPDTFGTGADGKPLDGTVTFQMLIGL